MKIFFETNTIIDASIYVESESSNLLFKHDHYDKSNELFELLEDQNNVAITSTTVKYETMKKVVQIAKAKHQKHSSKTRITVFQAVNTCVQNASDLFESMRVEDIDAQQYLQLTDDMAQHLTSLYGDEYTPERIRQRAQEAYSYQNLGELRDSSFYDLNPYMKQFTNDAVQLREFVEKERLGKNSIDKTILADAIELKNKYNGQKFYTCSRDKRFFSPLYLPGKIKSEIVTREIQKRFGIVCREPRDLILIVEEYMGTKQ